VQIPANVQAILRNKWALAGVGVAAGAGLLTLARRKGDPQANSTAEDNASMGAGSAQFPDSGMTDLATALGDIDSRYAEQVGIFRGQLATDHAALLAMQKQLQKPAAPAKPKPAPAKTAGPAWGPDVPADIRAKFTAAKVGTAIRRTGHSYGSVINAGDLAAALKRKRHHYGGRVDPADVAKLF